jgi:hypothetical protein
MRQLGKFLAGLGLCVGIILGIAMMLPIHLVGVGWLVGVGLAKLTFLGSLGLIGTGAVLQRIANRDERKRLSDPGGR